MKTRHLVILLVDDDEIDTVFLKSAVQKSGTGHSVYSAATAFEAMSYLKGDSAYADRRKFPFPDLIMLDLKMPVMDGFEFLRWLRKHRDCSAVPTVVFSSSP